MDSKLEQRVCFKTGYTATDMYKLLQKAHGRECLLHTMVFKWLGRFRNSCEC